MSEAKNLADIFDADRHLRAAEARLMNADKARVIALLSAAVEEAKGLQDEKESAMRLERLADLCAQVPGPEMIDALLRILDDEAPRVRVHAAEALVDVAFERYAEVARAVERAPKAGVGDLALQELPWIVAEVAEPSAVQLIGGLLGHDKPEVIASAIEALASLGDPAGVPLLQPLVDDGRSVGLDEYDGELNSSLGQLATEAIGALQDGDDPD